MARIVISEYLPGDQPQPDTIQVIVETGHDHPDGLDQAMTTALRGFREALGVTLAAGEDEDE